MSEDIGRCEEVNEVLKLRCDRPAGHRGVHIQYDSNGAVQGWGTFDEMNETVIPDHTAQRSGGLQVMSCICETITGGARVRRYRCPMHPDAWADDMADLVRESP